MKKNIGKFLPLIGFIIFLYILSKLNLAIIKSLFGQVNFSYFLIAFLILIPFYLIKVYRWKFIMSLQGLNYSFKNTILMHAVGIFWGSITPANAGDLAKAFYLKKDGYNWKESFFNVLLDRLADIIFLILFGYLSLFLFFNLFQKTIFIFSIFFIVLALISFLLIKNQNYKKILIKIFCKILPSKYQESWELNFQDFVNETKKYNLRDYFKIAMITIFSWFLYYIIVYFLALGVHIQTVPFWAYSVAVTLASLASLLPVSISGIGTRDAVFILIFTQFGIIFEKAIALSLMVLLFFMTLTLFGLICSFLKPLNLKKGLPTQENA